MEANEAKKILLEAQLNPTERIALNVLLAELDCEDLPGETWRDVGDFEDYYQISTEGRVKSFHDSPHHETANNKGIYARRTSASREKT